MTDSLAADVEYEGADIPWQLLGKVYLIANDKGGVGKSTIAANAAGQAAQAGLRTLAVDVNAQGNMALDLGISKSSINDHGRSIFLAVTADEPLRPARQVRPNLDFLPGGTYIRRIPGSLASSMTTEESARYALLSLARALVQIADQYDLIILDSPPENELLLQLVLCAARFVVVPMKTDEASRVGLRALAKVFRKMQHVNPCLILLGVVIFGSGTGATKLRANLRRGVERDLKGAAPVFNSFIRHAEAVGGAARGHGALVHELENMLRDGKVVQRSDGDDPDDEEKKDLPVVPETAKKVAGDIENLLNEMFSKAKEKRMELKKEGLWL